MAMLIELTDVHKAFNQGKPNEFWAIQGITTHFEVNRISCLKGASGSGKTTLMSMIGCLSRPTRGRIRLQERTISSLPERFLTEVRRHTFGFIFQRFNLIPGLSVVENIMLPAYPLGLKASTLRKRADGLLEQFLLADKANNPVEWLSGGEAQRVAICRALINDPQVLIADEPTANLDSRLSREFMVLLDELSKAGKTVLISSHDPVVFDSPVVNRVVELEDGVVIAEGR
ncbi:MAG: ABC transporter ATP-binding protein [Candidatus Thiodiazotropha sp.]|nr:ABC transporter ATP-binding protein [Chromatiales bacterium]